MGIKFCIFSNLLFIKNTAIFNTSNIFVSQKLATLPGEQQNCFIIFQLHFQRRQNQFVKLPKPMLQIVFQTMQYQLTADIMQVYGISIKNI